MVAVVANDCGSETMREGIGSDTETGINVPPCPSEAVRFGVPGITIGLAQDFARRNKR